MEMNLPNNNGSNHSTVTSHIVTIAGAAEAGSREPGPVTSLLASFACNRMEQEQEPPMSRRCSGSMLLPNRRLQNMHLPLEGPCPCPCPVPRPRLFLIHRP